MMQLSRELFPLALRSIVEGGGREDLILELAILPRKFLHLADRHKPCIDSVPGYPWIYPNPEPSFVGQRGNHNE
jgi:hypothetical protein